MDTLAKKLINDHRNPIVKGDISGSKLFFKSSTAEETEYVEKHQINLEKILSHERAERRCGRSQAEWLPDDTRAKVTKAVKALNHFGYQDRNGTYLYPEEALYLMETNRLEVKSKDVPLSIQEGYDLFLKPHDILKYRVYKKLVLQGYKLLRYSELSRRLSKLMIQHEKDSTKSKIQNSQTKSKRTREEENEELDLKKKKIVNETETSIQDSDDFKSLAGASTTSTQSQTLQVQSIFERLRQTAPKDYVKPVTEDVVPDYCIFLPTNKNRCDYDFNLYICENTSFMNYKTSSIPSVFAICTDGNISFHRFGNVKLPCL